LVAVDAANRRGTFEFSSPTGILRTAIGYDFLHVVPPMSAHAYVRESGLACESGPQKDWLEVDRATLQHPRFPDVFGVGDVTGIPNSKTGAAVRKQVPVVVANLLARMKRQPLPAKYDGYSSCPLGTRRGRVILAEFGYDGKLLPSFPLDPTKERWTMWILKRHLLSRLYWHGMLPGRL
jgi:sulfide:quinone oxidoreductase